MNDINFYAEETNQGDSIWPFLNFCLFLASVIIMIYGIVNFVTVWREFRLYYDASAIEEKPDFNLKKKEMLKYGIITGIGLFIFVLTFFLY